MVIPTILLHWVFHESHQATGETKIENFADFCPLGLTFLLCHGPEGSGVLPPLKALL